MSERAVHVGLYGELDMNLIDGSSVWLQSIALVLSRVPGVRLTVLLRVPERRSILLDPIRAIDGCRIVDPADVLLGCRRLEAGQAADLLERLDAERRFDVLVVRGSAVSDAIVSRGAFDGRIWFYWVPRGGATAEEELAALRRSAAASHRVLCQTEAIRARVRDAAPQLEDRLLLLSPMVPPIEGDSPGDPSPIGPARRLFYAGKFAPDYFFLEMVELFRRLREQRPLIELHIAGDKIHNPPDDPTFMPAARAALCETQGLVWHGPLPRAEVLALLRRSDLALSIRHPGMDASAELSTKILEYGVAGSAVALNRNPLHEQLLGRGYPLLVSGLDDAQQRLIRAIDDPTLRREARARCFLASSAFTFDRVAERLAAHLADAATASTPTAGARRAGTHVVVAGHDLKFFAKIADHIALRGAEVREDIWRRHNVHDEQVSRAALEWADIIVCEWCLGNAIWYSRHKREDQRLVVRMHRMEVETDYPTEVDLDNVDAMVFVAQHIRDAACDAFRWRRDDPRFHIIPNAIDVEGLHCPKLPGAERTIGMIGWVNRRKRLDRALDVLERVRARDARFRMVLKGKPPWEIPWMYKRDDERLFYDQMFRRIRRSPLLGPAVEFEQFGEVGPYLQKVAFILSLSESEGHPIGVAEGMASGAAPVIYDRLGAKRQYPNEWVHESAQAAAEAILTIAGNGGALAAGERARDYVQQWSWRVIGPLWDGLIASVPVTARLR